MRPIAKSAPARCLRAAALPLLTALAVLVAGCGGGEGKISEADSKTLGSTLEQTKDFYDNGRCDEADAELADAQRMVDDLDVDPEIKDGLDQLMKRLDDQLSDCESTEETTTTETSTSVTDPTTTETDTSTTDSTTSSTTDSSSTSTTSSTSSTTSSTPTVPPDDDDGDGGIGGEEADRSQGKAKGHSKDPKGKAKGHSKKPKKESPGNSSGGIGGEK